MNTPAEATALRTQAAGLMLRAAVMPADQGKPLIDQANSLSHQANTLIHWQAVWLFPCIAAGLIMVLFFLLFRDDTKVAATPPSVEPAETSAV